MVSTVKSEHSCEHCGKQANYFRSFEVEIFGLLVESDEWYPVCQKCLARLVTVSFPGSAKLITKPAPLQAKVPDSLVYILMSRQP